MEVLVTGGCGYIGSHVTRQLSEAGYKVVVVDDLSTGFEDSLIHGEKFYAGDVGDEALLEKIFNAHEIVSVLHFAGSIVVPESVAEPLKYYENNTAKTVRLLKVCTRHEVKHFIFSSTASVYGEKPANKAMSETESVAPTNPYSRSKLMSEWTLEDLGRTGALRYVALRYFNVAGADPEKRMGQRSPNATHLIKVACEVVTGKRSNVTIFGEDYPTPDGTGVRDYIHVEDLAAAHLAALRYLEQGGQSDVFNCGYGRGYSVKEVLEELTRIAGKLEINRGPRRPGDVASLVADVTKIHKTMDWRPRYDDLSVIVRSALEWERKLAQAHAAKAGRA